MKLAGHSLTVTGLDLSETERLVASGALVFSLTEKSAALNGCTNRGGACCMLHERDNRMA